MSVANSTPNAIEAIRKRKPAQASATTNVPDGTSMMVPSE